MARDWKAGSASEAVKDLERVYEHQIAAGTHIPWTYPWATIGFGTIILYLLVDHRQSKILRRMRVAVWLLNTLTCVYTLLYIRCKNNAPALGVGIISGWQIIWSASFMLWDDCQADYARIVRRLEVDQGQLRTDMAYQGDAEASSLSPSAAAANSRARKVATVEDNGSAKEHCPPAPAYQWQTYPVTLKERFFWILDLLTNVRGMNWNWRTANVSPPPASIQATLKASLPPPCQPSKPSRILARAYDSRRAVVVHNLRVFLRNYAILDMIKTLMTYDPYFWGAPRSSLPAPPYLPGPLGTSYVFARLVRVGLCVAAVKYALAMIFALGPLLQVGLLGTKVMGHKAEAWMHPAQFGSFSLVLDHGLAGFWGAFWHQFFRKPFETPGEKLVGALGLEPRSQTSKIVKLFVAFGLSGFMHACGSATQLGPTNPVTMSFTFFLLQAPGVIMEMIVKGQLKRLGVTERSPRWLRRGANLAFCVVYMYYTGPLLMDDFASGGVWLFEPVPFSFMRGVLGLGAEEEGVWRWYGMHVKWQRGDRWWQTGIIL